MKNKKDKKKIVIYGGSFNPPHTGHAVAIETVMRLFDCDEVWVMPSASRADKPNLVDGEHRYAMLNIMLDEFFSDTKIPVELSRLEIERPKLTTTLDTKLELETKYPDSEFWFLVGSDLLLEIQDKWVNGKELYHSTHFIAIQRPNFLFPKTPPPSLVLLGEGTIWPMISSTFIRGLIKEGHSPLPYVSPGVATYIKEQHLY